MLGRVVFKLLEPLGAAGRWAPHRQERLVFLTLFLQNGTMTYVEKPQKIHNNVRCENGWGS